MAGIRIETLLGDLTKCQVDAIVVGKRASLCSGGDVFYSIASNSKCSECFRRECNKLGACLSNAGSAVLIDGCGLPARHIILVPLPSSTKEAVSSVVAAIECAHTNGLQSIALPLLGYGAVARDLTLSDSLRGLRLTESTAREGQDFLRMVCVAIARCCFHLQQKESNLKAIELILHSDALKESAITEFDRIANESSLVQTFGSNIGSDGLPNNWTPLEDGKAFSLVPMPSSSREFITIDNELKKLNGTLGSWTLHAVLRVQSPTPFKLYCTYREKLEKKYSSSLSLQMGLERSLFHGTRADAVELIAEHGFDRSYSGQKAPLYGHGTYFARDIRYSAQDQYSAPGEAISLFQTDGRQTSQLSNRFQFKYIFRAKVLVGRVCLGKSDMHYLPTALGNAAPDCAVDYESAPDMFIIFKDAQAYPEYLLVLINSFI